MPNNWYKSEFKKNEWCTACEKEHNRMPRAKSKWKYLRTWTVGNYGKN